MFSSHVICAHKNMSFDQYSTVFKYCSFEMMKSFRIYPYLLMLNLQARFFFVVKGKNFVSYEFAS